MSLRSLLLSSLLPGCLLAAESPYGHPDFLPSPDQPSGFRGDGSGVFPAATPPVAWDDPSGAGIIWKAPLPSISYAHPIIVGRRVLVMSDATTSMQPEHLLPTLSCYDADDGTLLWCTGIDHLRLLGGAADRVREAWSQTMRLKATGHYLAAQVAGGRLTPEDEEFQALRQQLMELGAASFEQGKRGWGARWSKEAERRANDLRKEHGLGWDPWHRSDDCHDNCETITFATPVSDGEHVWVTTGYNAVACLDLDGRIRWLKHFPITETKLKGYHLPSPTLRQGILVTNQEKTLRAFEAASGKVLWEREVPWYWGYFCGTRRHFTLPSPSGETVEVMITGNGQLIRLRDGRLLADKLGHMGNGRGPAVLGDLVFVNCSAEGGGYKPCDPRWEDRGIRALRLTLDGADSASVEELWRVEESGALTAVGDVVYVDNSLAIEALTGKVIGKRRGVRPEHLVTIAGNRMYAIEGRVRAKDGERKTWRMEVLTLTPGFGESRTNVFTFEEGDDDRLRRRAEECNALMWSYFTRNGAVFQGDRMYLRSHEHLYCIGDPARPYHPPTGSEPLSRR